MGYYVVEEDMEQGYIYEDGLREWGVEVSTYGPLDSIVEAAYWLDYAAAYMSNSNNSLDVIDSETGESVLDEVESVRLDPIDHIEWAMFEPEVSEYDYAAKRNRVFDEMWNWEEGGEIYWDDNL